MSQSTFAGPKNLSPFGYQQITSLSTSVAVALTVPAPTNAVPATLALIQAETQDVRWRDDSTDPTSSVGMVLAAGETLPYTGDLSKLKFIGTTAGATLNISYYR